MFREIGCVPLFMRNTLCLSLVTQKPIKEAALEAAKYSIYRDREVSFRPVAKPLELLKHFKIVSLPKEKLEVTKKYIKYGIYYFEYPMLSKLNMTKEEIGLMALQHASLPLGLGDLNPKLNFAFSLSPKFFKSIVEQGFESEALISPLYSRMFRDGHRVYSFYGTYNKLGKVNNETFFTADLVGQKVFIPALSLESLDKLVIKKIEDTLEQALKRNMPTAFLLHLYSRSELAHKPFLTHKYTIRNHEWFNIWDDKLRQASLHPSIICLYDYESEVDFCHMIPDEIEHKIHLSTALSYKVSLYKHYYNTLFTQEYDKRMVKDMLMSLKIRDLESGNITKKDVKPWFSSSKVVDILNADLDYFAPVKYVISDVFIKVTEIRYNISQAKRALMKKGYLGGSFDLDLISTLLSYMVLLDDFFNITEGVFKALEVESETLVNPFVTHSFKCGTKYSSLCNDFMFGAAANMKPFTSILVTQSHYLVDLHISNISKWSKLFLIITPFSKTYTKHPHILINSLPCLISEKEVVRENMMLLMFNGSKDLLKRYDKVLNP